jgi:hypothetical protein
MSRIQYDVIANMGVRGSLAGMRRMASAMKPVFAHISAIEQRLNSMGSTIRGTTQQTAGGWARTAGAVAATAGPAGLGLAVKHGLAFNKTMENATLQAGTMYQLFDFGAKAAEVANGQLSQWQYNLQASKAVFKELYKIAEQTPGSFGDVAMTYQNAAAGLATQTDDLRRHLEFMKRASLLGGLTGGRYDVLGAQMGRIMSGSAGAEMDVWKNLSLPLLKAGQAMKDASGNPIFGKDLKAGEELTLAFNKLGGDTRLQLMMKAMEKIGPEVASAWGNSMDGIMGTTQSALQTLGGRLTKPLYESFRTFLKRVNKNVFGEGVAMDRWGNFADQAGAKLAAGAEVVFRAAEQAASFIRDNWLNIMAYAQNTGEVIGGLIKGAFAWGLARWIAGTAILGLGKAAKGAEHAKVLAQKLKPIFDRQAKLTHAAIVRGAHDKRGGILGSLGRFLGARTNRADREHRGSSTFEQKQWKRNKAGRFEGGSGMGKKMVTMLQGRLGADPFRHIAKFLAHAGSVAMVFAAGIPAIMLAVAAFGSLFLIVGGIGAYVVSNWKAISSALIKGLDDGKITLMPLLTAAYAFWARLKIVGQVMLGGSDHATQFNGVLGMMVGIIGAGSTAVSFFLRSMAFFLGIWATLKLAMLGVARAILAIVEIASYLPGGPEDSTVEQARKNYQAYNDSVWETMEAGSKLLNTADRLDNFKFGALELAAIEKESTDMAQSLKDMLAGKGKENDKAKKPGAKVNIEKVDMKIDLRDEDPDRMMAMLIEPFARMAEHRVTSGALPAGGV